MKQSKTFFKALIMAALCGVTAYLSWIYTPVTPSPAENPWTIGGDFQLTDSQGQSRSSKEFNNRYVILYFGYGYCPDICPLALHNITDALHTLESEGRLNLVNKIQPLFITIDPERDTVVALKEFIRQFHPKFIALTGTPAEIKKTTDLYKVFYQKVNENQPQNSMHYLMDHSSVVYVMAPNGKYLGSFNHLTPSDEIALKLREWII